MSSYNNKISNNPSIKNLPHHILSTKYHLMNNEYEQMYINILIYSRPSHYLTLYKDKLLWDYSADFLRRFYITKEFRLKIPKIIAYYKNYIKFFCRPFFLNFGFAEILQGFLDQKAEVFYKEVYGNFNNEAEADGDKEREGHLGEDEDIGTIFNTSARKVIDCNVLTTIDFLPTQSDNREMIMSLSDTGNCKEDFFTIGPKNDFLIDLLNKMSHKKARGFNGRNRHSLYDYTIGIGYENHDLNMRDFDKDKPHNKPMNNNKTNKHSRMSQDLSEQYRNNHSNNIYKKETGYNSKQPKTQFKSNYCNLYKPKAVPPYDNKSYKKKLIPSPNTVMPLKKNNEINTIQLLSPKYQTKSNFTEWKKINNGNKSTSKSRKNSLIGKSNMSNNTQQYNYINQQPHHKPNKTTQFKYSIERPRSNVSNASNVNQNKTLNKIVKHSIMEDAFYHKDIKEEQKKKITFKKITKNKTYSHILQSATSNSNTNIINPRLKKCLSPSTSSNNNLLINYLHNCSHSRQSKRYFSLRNNSNEKSLPLPSLSNPHNQPHHRKSSSNQINISHNPQPQSKPHINPKPKSKSNPKLLFKKITFKSNKNPSNSTHANLNKREVNLNVNVNLNNIHININTSNLNNITMTTSSNAKGMIYRNKSHSNVFNEKMKSHNPSEVEKLINGIKMNLNSNRIIVNDIIKINKKGCVGGGNTLNNKNDSTQTSSNTHTNQGYAPSKSPKRIDSKKSTGGSNVVVDSKDKDKDKEIRSTKHSRKNSPGNLVNMFFSQRKQGKD